MKGLQYWNDWSHKWNEGAYKKRFLVLKQILSKINNYLKALGNGHDYEENFKPKIILY